MRSSVRDVRSHGACAGVLGFDGLALRVDLTLLLRLDGGLLAGLARDLSLLGRDLGLGVALLLRLRGGRSALALCSAAFSFASARALASRSFFTFAASMAFWRASAFWAPAFALAARSFWAFSAAAALQLLRGRGLLGGGRHRRPSSLPLFGRALRSDGLLRDRLLRRHVLHYFLRGGLRDGLLGDRLLGWGFLNGLRARTTCFTPRVPGTVPAEASSLTRSY